MLSNNFKAESQKDSVFFFGAYPAIHSKTSAIGWQNQSSKRASVGRFLELAFAQQFVFQALHCYRG
jgi:hypothetical protein